jgi:hypothetical protein
MAKFYAVPPNFLTPNHLVDDLMPLLTADELIMCLVIARGRNQFDTMPMDDDRQHEALMALAVFRVIVQLDGVWRMTEPEHINWRVLTQRKIQEV